MRSILWAACLAAGVLAGCGGGGGGGESATVPQVPALPQSNNLKVQFELVDASTGEPITDSLKVSVEGDATVKALDGTSLNGKQVTTSTGLLAVDASFSATARSFAVLVTDASGKGWVSTGTTVTGEAGANRDQLVTLKLLRPAAAASVNASTAPIAMATTTSTASATGTLPAVTVQTAPKTAVTEEGTNTTIGTAKIEIPADTRGTAADGSVAAPGPVTITNTYFAPVSQEAGEALPGGTAAEVTVPAASAGVFNVAAAEAAIAPAGFAQFNVTDSQGKAITTFDKPIALSIDLPKTTTDQNGNLVQAGGSFPVWSFDQASGNWVFEKLGTITEKVPADANNFSVVFQTNHLSSWMVSWLYGTCNQEIELTGKPVGDTQELYISLDGVNPAGWSGFHSTRDTRISATKARKGTVTFTIRDKYGRQVAYLKNQQMCGGQKIQIPVKVSSEALYKLEVTTTESCADGSAKRALPTSVRVRGAQLMTTVTASSKDVGDGKSAKAVVDGLLVDTQVMFTVLNPRTGQWIGTNAFIRTPVNAASWNFVIPCVVVTGGMAPV